MKKFLGAVLALAMIATTFVSTVFADDSLNVALSVDKDSYNVGDTVICTATITGSAFANFSLKLDYDAAAFDYVSGKISDDSEFEKSIVFGKTAAIAIYAGENNEDMSKTHAVEFTFQVKDGATGDYVIKLVDDNNKVYAYDAYDNEVTVAGEEVTVKVASVTPPVEEEVKTAIDGAYPEVTKDGIRAIGTSGTVTVPAGKSFSKIDFTFENSKGETGSYTWDFGTSISATTTYGLNIYNVPADVTSITCTSAEAK